MPRPIKCRRVGFIPKCFHFVPNAPEGGTDSEVIITIEEIEALRLSDLEGLEQSSCSESMGISRGTFQRILNNSRRKAADALVNGKPIRIEGGNYKREICSFICKKCGHKWVNSGEMPVDCANIRCTLCDCDKYDCSSENDFCGKHCNRHNENDSSLINSREGETDE